MTEIPARHEFGSMAKGMSFRDLRDVLQVGSTALEIREPDEQLSEVLYLLERIFRTGNNNFYFADNSCQSLNLNRVISRGIEREYFPKFKQYYYKLDPFYRILNGPQPPTVMVRDHSKSKGRLTEYYNDFLKPQSIHYQMSIFLKSRQRFLGVLGLYRPRGAEPFSWRDRTKANLLAPYLAGALEKAITSEQKSKQEGIIDYIATHLPYKGVIVLDEALESVYLNRYAARIFSFPNPRPGGPEASRPPLPNEVYSHCEGLLEAAPGDKGSGVSQTQGRVSCRVNGEWLNLNLRLITDGQASPLLFIYFAPQECGPDLWDRIRQYDLTQRQMEVVCLLRQGLTNKEIASMLFISRYTVENHLKAIYGKMNVASRTELVYRLQRASAGAAPEPGPGR